jgi:hypothetical protein
MVIGNDDANHKGREHICNRPKIKSVEACKNLFYGIFAASLQGIPEVRRLHAHKALAMVI